MLDIVVRGRVTTSTLKWFYDKPSISDCFKPVLYCQCKDNGPLFGFVKHSFHTKTIDLQKPESELLSDMKKNTKYEISRAERDNVHMFIEASVRTFAAFVREFEKSKNIKSWSENFLMAAGENLVITKAMSEDTALVMHSYLVDYENSIARILQSASLFRLHDDKSKAASIGRANRFLHFKDMLFFKNKGIRTYDLGGYALNTENEDLQKIADFKDGFGGELVCAPHYYSYLSFLISKIASALGQAKEQRQLHTAACVNRVKVN